MDFGLAPSEFSKLTLPQFFALLSGDQEKKPKTLSRKALLDYVKKYREEHGVY